MRTPEVVGGRSLLTMSSSRAIYQAAIPGGPLRRISRAPELAAGAPPGDPAPVLAVADQLGKRADRTRARGSRRRTRFVGSVLGASGHPADRGGTDGRPSGRRKNLTISADASGPMGSV